MSRWTASRLPAVTPPADDPASTATAPGRLGRFWRGLTGVLAAAIVLLALVVVGVQVYAGGHDLPGPGVLAVAGHVLAGALVVVGQRIADRHVGRLAGLAGLAVVVVSALALWSFWWA